MASGTKKTRTYEIVIHNAARLGVSVDRIAVTPLFGRSTRPKRLQLASSADGFLVIWVPQGRGCGTGVLGIDAHYASSGSG